MMDVDFWGGQRRQGVPAALVASEDGTSSTSRVQVVFIGAGQAAYNSAKFADRGFTERCAGNGVGGSAQW